MKRRLGRSLRLLASLCVFIVATAGAGEPPANPRLTGTPLLRVWRAEDYGGALLNHHVLVHPNGLVYVANDDGLLEFDGERWRLIPMPREGAARSLAVDARGVLWIFGHDDAARLVPDARGELRAVSVLDQLPPEARATGSIHHAAVTADGVYARGQRRIMLFRPDGTTQTWPVPNLAGLVWTVAGQLYADVDRLVRVSPAGMESVAFDAGTSAAETADLRVFAARPAGGDRTDEWLLLTARGPAIWRGPGTPLRPLFAAAATPFAGDLASAGAFLADGRLALGTEHSGVFIFEHDGRLSQHFDRTHGLPSNRVTDLAVDAEGGLWLATQEGLARLDLELPFALHGAPQGLTASPRRFATWRNELYLATADGVARRDARTGRFVAIAGFQVGANRPLVVGDRLLAATRGLREITADDQSRAWATELVGPIVASTPAPGWIYAGSSAGLWLIQPDPATGGWRTLGRLTTLAQGLDELLEQNEGWLWAVTRSGEIARIDFRAGPRLDAPTRLFTPADGVPAAGRNDRVQLLPVGGDLLAVGRDWLRRFDESKQSFVPETRLMWNGVQAHGVRLAGRSATRGAWFRTVEDPTRLLHVEAGADGAWRIASHSILPLRDVGFDSVFEEASTGTLWLAGQGVLASIDLARPVRSPASLPVNVRRIENESGEVLGTAGTAATPLRLEPDVSAVRVIYAAPRHGADLRGRGQTLYRTRLDGLDRTWSAWTREARRDFTNLPFGPLRFHVEARVPEQEDASATEVVLLVVPPWWQAPWMFAGYALAAAGVIYAGFKFRTRALRRRNAQLEAVVAARTHQLERINQELTDAVSIVSHELRGPVSGIRVLARQLRGTPHLWASAEGPEFLQEIERTSGAAVDMMARLLDLQRASDRAAGLVVMPTDLGTLVAGICADLESAAAAKRITLHVAAPAVTRVTDPEGVAGIVANLVSNAIKFLPADGRGEIHVTLDGDDRTCRLTVADNGPGLTPEERAALFEKFARGRARPTAGEASTGLGLYIVKKLVTALGGTIEVVDTPGGGATFVASWPAEIVRAPSAS